MVDNFIANTIIWAHMSTIGQNVGHSISYYEYGNVIREICYL